VNLEVDVLAKYTERLLSFAPQGSPAHRASAETSGVETSNEETASESAGNQEAAR